MRASACQLFELWERAQRSVWAAQWKLTQAAAEAGNEPADVDVLEDELTQRQRECDAAWRAAIKALAFESEGRRPAL